MEMCFECHGEGGAPVACDTCHAARLPAERIQTGVFSVTHGEDYLKTHGMGGTGTCSPCHAQSKCASCHGPGVPHPKDFVNKHAVPAKSDGAQCTTCHVTAFCSDCHQVEMPHPTEFVKSHGDLVEANSETTCRRCHDPADCTVCHEKHVHPVTIDQMEQLKQFSPGDER